MTLLELVKELNELVGNNPVEAQKEIDIYNSEIVFMDNTNITFYDDDEDPQDYDLEMGFDPYVGGYTFDC